MSEPHPKRQLACPLCGHTQFDKHEARQDTRWGVFSHRIQMLVCRQCAYVLHFYRHQSIFNFD